MIRQIVLDRLQRTLNRYVGESTAARDLLAELAGSSLAVEVAGLGVRCVLAARAGAIVVAETIDEPPTATVRAAPLDLLKLMRSARAGGVRATHAEVTGDLHVAEAFATLLKLARPDLEEELSHWVGDVAARELGLAAAGAVAWLERAGAALELNAAEFLQDEAARSAGIARGPSVLCRRRAVAGRRRARRRASHAIRETASRRMRRVRLILRMLAIQRTLVRYGLDEIVWRTHLFRPIAWIPKLLPRRAPTLPFGARLRLALEELGPIFVKFGQALSVRPDLLSSEVAEELAKLQDRVPPFASELAMEGLQRAFDRPLTELFSELEELPLAAASIAQVHAARLHDGTAVVVKILRPQVREIIQRDLEVLYALASLAEDYWSEARRLHPIAVVAEFEKTLHSELDLLREAANAAQLKRNFAGSEMLYVPEVYWDFCRPSVLTLERISGIPINQIDELRRRQTNIRVLAENGVEIFFTQVFRHNFFHADMHPGNIFVDVADPERPKYVAVDFGIVGTLDARDQHYLAENFLAFFMRDYRRVATLHVDSGWVPADTRVDELEAAVRAVCEPIFNKPLKDISFGVVLLRLFQTAREFHMEVQPQLVLLQKTLLAVEGFGKTTLSRARSVEDRKTGARGLDAPAPRSAYADQGARRELA